MDDAPYVPGRISVPKAEEQRVPESRNVGWRSLSADLKRKLAQADDEGQQGAREEARAKVLTAWREEYFARVRERNARLGALGIGPGSGPAQPGTSPENPDPLLVSSSISHTEGAIWTPPYAKGAVVFRRDVQVELGLRGGKAKGGSVGSRDGTVIAGLTDRSSARLAWTACNAECDWPTMVTLTYHQFDGEAAESKLHLQRFLMWLRKWYPGVFYLWWLEFQRRGVPHYHILLSMDLPHPRETFRRRWGKARDYQTHVPTWEAVAVQWLRAIGEYRTEKMGRHSVAVEAMEFADGRYACREAGKRVQKELPERWSTGFGRWWGCSYKVKPMPKRFVHMDGVELFRILGVEALRNPVRYWKNIHGGAERMPDTPF